MDSRQSRASVSFVSPPTPWVDPNWPFVWDVTHDIYFRPEGEGLLLCACDQTELAPGDPLMSQAGGTSTGSGQTREAYLIQKRDLKLDRPILLDLAYSRAELQAAGIDGPASLHVRYSNDRGSTWTPAPSMVVDDRVIVQVDHLTLFSLAGSRHRQYLPVAAH